VIGEVGEKVRSDALKAFNAHFPYLADEKKLEEHGHALLIPHLADDIPAEYRDRVTAASFFLMRSGERAFVLGQLNAHFGDRYILRDEFLNVYLKALDISEADRKWALSMLDELLDPNILLTVAEWFQFVETFFIEDEFSDTARRGDLDYLPSGTGFRCDGRVACNQGVAVPCDGAMTCDGAYTCTGYAYRRGTILDEAKMSVRCDGSFNCLGEQDCSGYKTVRQTEPISDPVAVGGGDEAVTTTLAAEWADRNVIPPRCDGSWKCDGSNQASLIDAPMILRVTKPFACDGLVQCGRIACDGSITCNGSYRCDGDAHRCMTELISEEVL
jgi:hypothetical protein